MPKDDYDYSSDPAVRDTEDQLGYYGKDITSLYAQLSPPQQAELLHQLGLWAQTYLQPDARVSRFLDSKLGADRTRPYAK